MLTHDLCLPVAVPHMQQGSSNVLLLLLSETDFQPPNSAMDRIQRLYLQGGTSQIGIVFLLHESSGTSNGLASMMNLQIR
jgi:hypothetical protein